MRTNTNILAASIPVEIKSNFVSNIVSRIRDFTSGLLVTNKIAAIGAVIFSAVFIILREVLWKPSRTYDRDANSVGREYDAWTTEGILEEYWGEHIHLGYYSPEELAAGYKKKNFIQAKYDFVDQMMDFGKARSLAQPMTVLDVGCGIGGKINALILNPDVKIILSSTSRRDFEIPCEKVRRADHRHWNYAVDEPGSTRICASGRKRAS
jgi:hypothetical protein